MLQKTKTRIIKASLLLTCVIPMAFTFTTDVTTDSYTGYAYEEGTKDLIYTEEFTDKFIDGKHTETLTKYYDPKHKQIAIRKMDFNTSNYAPDFKTEDLRTGYVEGAEVKGDKVKLFFKENKNSKLEEKTIHVPKPVVIDGGFNQYIKANWDKLLDGEKLTFHFTVSSRLDYFTLRASKVELKDKVLKIKIDPDKSVIRWIASPIIIKYNTETKRIISYEGKSNIADSNGENFMTRLVYPKKGP